MFVKKTVFVALNNTLTFQKSHKIPFSSDKPALTYVYFRCYGLGTHLRNKKDSNCTYTKHYIFSQETDTTTWDT